MELILVILNSLIFLIYGLLCLFTRHMYEEFKRYKLLKYRKLTGILEVCGSLGSIIGVIYYLPLLLFSSCGLACLMALGIFTRLRVKDKWHELLPALVLLVLNAYIFYATYSDFGMH